jgi:hypothetical protein
MVEATRCQSKPTPYGRFRTATTSMPQRFAEHDTRRGYGLAGHEPNEAPVDRCLAARRFCGDCRHGCLDALSAGERRRCFPPIRLARGCVGSLLPPVRLARAVHTYRIRAGLGAALAARPVVGCLCEPGACAVLRAARGPVAHDPRGRAAAGVLAPLPRLLAGARLLPERVQCRGRAVDIVAGDRRASGAVGGPAHRSDARPAWDWPWCSLIPDRWR